MAPAADWAWIDIDNEQKALLKKHATRQLSQEKKNYAQKHGLR
jgi:hypothetical protein